MISQAWSALAHGKPLNFFLVQMHLRMRLRFPGSKACVFVSVEAGSNLRRKFKRYALISLRLAASTPTRRDLVSRKRSGNVS